MARIDKTDSAVGVVRAPLNFAIVSGEYDTLIGVGLNAQGRIVKGAGNTGILGVINPSKARTKIGQITDIFVLGDAVDCVGLAAGTTYWADGVTGALAAGAAGTGAQPGAGSGSSAGSVKIGFTVEADRLVIRK
jgi:hypothetical protein